MKTYTTEELNKILEDHKHWLREDCEGWPKMRADLTGADLREADLTGADLRGAYLTGADLRGARNIPLVPLACPSHGSFVGWKKANVDNPSGATWDKAIVKLEIPEDAKRTSATTNKCRCDKAKVIAAYRMDGKELDRDTPIKSMHDTGFTYKVGDIITPEEPFCEDRWQECASGIHFFINRSEAERW